MAWSTRALWSAVAAFVVASVLVAAPPAAAETATLVPGLPRDEAGSLAGRLTTVGDQVFLTAEDVADEEVLWRTDGTQVQQVLDTGDDAVVQPYELQALGTHLYWLADGQGTTAGYRTDGTVVEALDPSGPASREYATAVGNGWVFYDGGEVWSTDGTSTTLLQGATPTFPYTDCNDDLFTAGGGYAWFINGGDAIWRTDGAVLEAAVTGLAASPLELEWHDGALWFTAVDPSGEVDLWEVTAGGPVLRSAAPLRATQNSACDEPSWLTSAGGALWLRTYEASFGSELGRYDPVGGVAVAADLAPGTADGLPAPAYSGERRLAHADGRLWVASATTEQGLSWFTDADEGRAADGAFTLLEEDGGHLYVAGPNGLGRTAGPVLQDLGTAVQPVDLEVLGDDLLLAGLTGSGVDLYRIDLTAFVPGPDLAVSSVLEPPQYATLDGTFPAGSTVVNEGTADAAASTVRYYLSADAVRGEGDVLLGGTRSVPLLAPAVASGGPTPVTVPGSTAPGQYRVLACADDLAAVAESDETDNCRASATSTTVGRADYAVTAVTDPPAERRPGTTFTAGDTTGNGGTTGSTVPTTTAYYLSTDTAISGTDQTLGTRTVLALAPGESSTGTAVATIPTTTPAGRYYVLACADATARLTSDGDGTNNCRASVGSVRVGVPDLVVTSVRNPPDVRRRGQTFTAGDRTANTGTLTAPSSRTRYYLSRDRVRSSTDRLLAGYRPVASIAIGSGRSGTRTVRIPSSTPRATYYVLACADDTRTVVESSDRNNCRAATDRIRVT